jgi:60S ribosome subunit biogenesis protein NIP7
MSNHPSNQGVLVFSMGDVPLGFGVTAKSTQECRKCDPSAIVCYNNSDTGEYLRDEETI